jgi:hypothetical protein
VPNKEHYLVPVLIGGAVAGVLSSIPFVSALNCIFCLWMLVGAALAVMLVQNMTHSVQIGEAAAIGALAGVVCALITGAFSAAMVAISGAPAIPAAAQGQMRELFEGGGSIVLLIGATCMMQLIIYPLFGALGGLIGGAIFKPSAGGPGAGGDGGFGPPPGGGFGAPPGGGFGQPPGGFGPPPGQGGPPPGGFGPPPGSSF